MISKKKPELLKAIQETGFFTETELQWVQDEFKSSGYSKNDFLLKKGEVSKSFFFLTHGSVYEYEPNEDGEHKIQGLYTPNNWVINHKNFTTQKPSDTYIKAYTDCKVYELTIHSMHTLIDKSQVFLQMGRLLSGYTTLIDRLSKFKTPDEKYQHLLEYDPVVIESFPLKMIASLLGITPETLSRVRNRIM